MKNVVNLVNNKIIIIKTDKERETEDRKKQTGYHHAHWQTDGTRKERKYKQNKQNKTCTAQKQNKLKSIKRIVN